MPIYSYEKTRISKKTQKRVVETFYYFAGKYTDPLTKERKQYKKRGFKKKSEAEAAEIAFLHSLNMYSNSIDITYDQLFQAYYNDRKGKVKERSLTDLSHTYNTHIKPVWNDIKIHDITLAMIMNWQHSLLEMSYSKKENGKVVQVKYSNEYLTTIQSFFKTVLNHGVKLGYKIDPRAITFQFVKNKNEIKKEMLFWEPEEFNAFIDQADDIQFKALFCLLYWCGLRIGEALALNWEDIDFNTRTVKVNKTYDQKNRIVTAPKTANSYRNIIMPIKCSSVLKEWYETAKYYGEDKQKHIIFGVNQPLDDNTIRRKKDKWSKAAGVKNIRVHDFRHSHVSLLINQNFSAFDISKRLGHTVDMVNNRYGHWFNDQQQKMADALDNL